MNILPTLRSKSPKLCWANSAIPAVGIVSWMGTGLLLAHCSNCSAARPFLIWYCFFTATPFFLAENFPELITARGRVAYFQRGSGHPHGKGRIVEQLYIMATQKASLFSVA